MLKLEEFLLHLQIFCTDHKFLRSVTQGNSLTWWHVLKTSWRYLWKTSWRCLEDVFARRLKDVLKTSWRRLEDVLPRRIYWVSWIYSSWSRRLLKTKTKDVFKTSSSRRIFAGPSTNLSHKYNLLRRTLQVKQQVSEAVVCRLQFLKILQTPQENICVWVYERPATLLKRDFNTGVFLWNLQNF